MRFSVDLVLVVVVVVVVVGGGKGGFLLRDNEGKERWNFYITRARPSLFLFLS